MLTLMLLSCRIHWVQELPEVCLLQIASSISLQDYSHKAKIFELRSTVSGSEHKLRRLLGGSSCAKAMTAMTSSFFDWPVSCGSWVILSIEPQP